MFVLVISVFALLCMCLFNRDETHSESYGWAVALIVTLLVNLLLAKVALYYNHVTVISYHPPHTTPCLIRHHVQQPINHSMQHIFKSHILKLSLTGRFISLQFNWNSSEVAESTCNKWLKIIERLMYCISLLNTTIFYFIIICKLLFFE